MNGVGDEDLDVYIRKLCYEPSDWVVDPSDFGFSMVCLFYIPNLLLL